MKDRKVILEFLLNQKKEFQLMHYLTDLEFRNLTASKDNNIEKMIDLLLEHRKNFLSLQLEHRKRFNKEFSSNF